MADPLLQPVATTRPVLRIFVTSLTIDLRDYRDKVRDGGFLLGDTCGLGQFSIDLRRALDQCR